MKITAKLAYSQLKINRSRTIWTLGGIALSTALITAVWNFAASGDNMLANVLGANYGDQRQSVFGLLLIPIVFLSIIVVSMTVVVISNVFRISANERMAQFGALKSIGATKKQIMTTVMHESILVSAVGIPVGIVLGLLLSFVGVNIARYFLDELNSLIHMMMTEITWELEFVISWQALTAATIVSVSTVLFSAWLPAHKAAKMSAIDSIRGLGKIKMETKKLHTNPLVQILFGFEGTLAEINMKRNRHVFRATVISLTVGIVLFINLSALGKQAEKLQDFMSIDVDATILTEYTSSYSSQINEKTGREETIYDAPLHSELGSAVTEKLREFQNTKTFGAGGDMQTYHTMINREQISAQMLDVMAYPQQQKSYEMSVEILTLDKENYAALCRQAGVPNGSNILLNHYSYNDNGKEVDLVPFSLDGKEVSLIKADGSAQEIKVHGILMQDEIPKELFYPNTKMVRLVVPEAMVRSYTWFSEPADMASFTNYANQVMDEVFPNDENEGYMEAGFNTRVYEVNDYVKVMNMIIVITSIFMYSFVILLMLIGLTNVISTMSTNVLMRAREFAVLQSVGMTPEGLKRMLDLESILCSAKALLFGLPTAILFTYMINLPIKARIPIPYELPWFAIVVVVCTVFLLTWVTTRFAVHRLRNGNIIEIIRSESGR